MRLDGAPDGVSDPGDGVCVRLGEGPRGRSDLQHEVDDLVRRCAAADHDVSFEGFDLDAAVEQLWLYMAPDQYARLVDGRGWSHERVEAWFAARLRDLLRRPE